MAEKHEGKRIRGHKKIIKIVGNDAVYGKNLSEMARMSGYFLT
jgi:hypothetical protein